MKNTPLYQEHLRLGARMAPFAGWNMPIQYSGIIQEHLHTRTKAGLFDICHMGEFLLKGKSAGKDINHITTCRIDNMPAGRCHYGFMLNENGGIIDDLIVFKITDDEFMLVVNAGTTDKDKEWIKSHLSNKTNFEDISPKTAKFDLQGPLSKTILSSYTNINLDNIKKYQFATGEVSGAKTIISRTGYTGELGYELYFSSKEAAKLWNMFLKNKDVLPIGLGARDTLRLEMGYSLYGQDIDQMHTPLEANLEKFIHMGKDFIGKDFLDKQKNAGIKNILVGFIAEGRQSPRHNFNVVYHNKVTGIVTSASFSPCLKKAIGLCYMEKDIGMPGNQIVLTNNEIFIKAAITVPPFYKK